MATFAVAALVVAVLFADRLISPEDLRRRFYQVGLGVAAALLTAAVAAMVFPAPQDALESLQFGDTNELGAGLLRERLSLITGTAFALLVGSLYQWRTFPTLSVGGMLGALILLVSSAADSGGGGFINFYYELTLDGGATRNVIYGGITAIGVVLLLVYGFNEWDHEEEPTHEEAEA